MRFPGPTAAQADSADSGSGSRARPRTPRPWTTSWTGPPSSCAAHSTSARTRSTKRCAPRANCGLTINRTTHAGQSHSRTKIDPRWHPAPAHRPTTTSRAPMRVRKPIPNRTQTQANIRSTNVRKSSTDYIEVTHIMLIELIAMCRQGTRSDCISAAFKSYHRWQGLANGGSRA
jgi:hypothetical protein